MKLTKTTIIAIIAATGLLAASPALRAQTATNAADMSKAPKKKGGKMYGPTIDMYKEQLKLTDAQVPKVQAAMDEQMKARTALAPEDRATKGPEIRAAFDAKMKGILDADQYKLFQAMPQGRGGKGKKAADTTTPPPPPAPPAPATK